ncbi:MAG: phage protein Gp36 family protein [Leeuwenhoekiella sp.]|uniref:phage protein Gp36 family protein n=1 Tax=Leeuwenhoekiella sp. TaxID=1977054 RepID=UPI0032427CAC
MAFLTDEDFDPQIRGWVRNVVNQGSQAVQLKAELAAQVEMESYLRNRYDTGLIFEAEGDNRNALVVMYMVDIAVYHLHANISPENVPEIRQIRYDAAIDWLKRVAKGDISPRLPELTSDPDNPEGDSLFLQMGSNDKVSERF